MYKKYGDAVIGGFLAVLSCAYIAMSFQIKLTNIDRIVGSRMFPQICGAVVLALSIYLIVNGLRSVGGAKTGSDGGKKSRGKTVIVLGSYAAYIFLMDKIGFGLSSVIYLFSQMVVMGTWPVRKKTLLVYGITSAAASAVIYILFNRVFLLMLPRAEWL